MPKMKTHSGAKKRLRALPSGKVKRSKVNKRHILSKKTSKRKRHLGEKTYVNEANERAVKQLLVL